MRHDVPRAATETGGCGDDNDDDDDEDDNDLKRRRCYCKHAGDDNDDNEGDNDNGNDDVAAVTAKDKRQQSIDDNGVSREAE